MSQYRRPPDDVDKMTSLRVGNIPFKTHQEDLKEVFEKYGEVGDVFIPSDRETGRTRGFAFVRFYDKKDAEDAMEELNGRTFEGRDLRVSIDEGRPRGGGGGGRGGGGERSRSKSRKRSPSSSSSSSSTPEWKRKVRARQICDGTFGAGDGKEPMEEKVVKVGVYKDIEDEDNRRAATGEPPLSVAEKDIMMRNWFRVQRGEAPLPAHPMTKGGGVAPKYGNYGGAKGFGKGKVLGIVPQPAEFTQAVAFCAQRGHRGVTDEEILWLVAVRERTRKNCDYASADALRDAMKQCGVEVHQKEQRWTAADGRGGEIPAWNALGGYQAPSARSALPTPSRF